MNVGIDLGTTNSALAYIDSEEAAEADFPPLHVLPIEQQVDANRTAALRTLPSFLYLSEPPVAGAFARDQGALVPTKTVHSAKSWLSNSEADRTAKILPWDSQEEGRVLSPVEASTRYLTHLREAWERTKGTPLAEQQVVLTVPASFDEEARELTVEAARAAGIESLTLLEEPAAAFTPGSPATWRAPTRNCSMGRLCWCATWAAVPAISRWCALTAKVIASSSRAPRWAVICCWAEIILI